jgi:hypothetical protein
MTETLPAPIAPFQRPDALQIMFDERLFAQACKLAGIMAQARGFIPKHLAGSQEACFAVVVTAMTTGLNPYEVANGTYQTPGGKVGMEGSLVQAILEASGRFVDDKITFTHTGPWERVQGKFQNVESKHKDSEGNAKYYAKRTWTNADAVGCKVTVSGHVKGEAEPRTYELELTQCIANMNSTLWAIDPKTQICYRAVRGFNKLACPSITKGLPLGDDEPPGQMIDVTPAAERPQLDEPAATDAPWQVTNQFGEVCLFLAPEPAASALFKLLDAAAHTGMTSLKTTMDNNGGFLDALSEAGERTTRIELLAHYQQLKKSLQHEALKILSDSETSTISTAPPAETPSPTSMDAKPAVAAQLAELPVNNPQPLPPTMAEQGIPDNLGVGEGRRAGSITPDDGMPADISPADHRFWTNATLAVACPKKGNAPDWRMYPLALGPRIRQAWTLSLLNLLWRDNVDNMKLFEQTQGALAAGDLKRQFAERKQALIPAAEEPPFVER